MMGVSTQQLRREVSDVHEFTNIIEITRCLTAARVNPRRTYLPKSCGILEDETSKNLQKHLFRGLITSSGQGHSFR